MTSSQQQQQQPSEALALPQQNDESIASPSSTAYTPVLSSVKLITDRVSHNGLVRSSLSRLQSMVPESVSATAVSAAGQAAQISEKYAGPLVQRVDSSLNGAIVGLLSLPAYGSAKVQRADEIAYALTPEMLKSTYSATRAATLNTVTKVKDLSGRGIETVSRVRSERSAQLKSALSQLQAKIDALRTTLANTSSQARQALDLQTRISELQAKVNQAIGVATEKGAQARHLSNEILTSAADLTVQFRGFVESNLSDSQRDTLSSYWARVMEGVNALKESLHLGGSNVASPASSRSDSAADAAEAEVEAASKISHEANGEHVLSEPVASESESAPADESKAAAPSDKKHPGGGKQRKGKKTHAAASAEEESKQKVAAEDE